MHSLLVLFYPSLFYRVQNKKHQCVEKFCQRAAFIFFCAIHSKGLFVVVPLAEALPENHLRLISLHSPLPRRPYVPGEERFSQDRKSSSKFASASRGGWRWTALGGILKQVLSDFRKWCLRARGSFCFAGKWERVWEMLIISNYRREKDSLSPLSVLIKSQQNMSFQETLASVEIIEFPRTFQSFDSGKV